MNDSFFEIKLMTSLSEFRQHTTEWNDLWERSTTANPCGRAELLALWTEQFAPGRKIRIIAVVDKRSGHWVAGLFLAQKFKYKILKLAELPRVAGGTVLLIEPSEDAEEIMQQLVAEMQCQTIFHWMMFEEIRLHSYEWSLFQKTLTRSGLHFQTLKTNDTAIVPLDKSFDELLLQWNKNKVKEVIRLLKKLGKSGTVELVKKQTPQEIAEALPICFEIENQGWKGTKENGLSILKRGLTGYFTQNALILARNGYMILWGLVFNGTWIAFHYDYAAKDTVFCNKISYSPEYHQYSPGFLLHYLICQHLRTDRTEITKFDYVGDFMKYQSQWNPKLDEVGQIVFPTRNILGRFFFTIYNKIMPIVRNFRTKKKGGAD